MEKLRGRFETMEMIEDRKEELDAASKYRKETEESC